MSWPHPHGTHRGDRRSSARGAASARVRWTWRAGAKLPSPLVHDERIAVVADRKLAILDADGRVQQSIPLAAEAWLGLLAPEGPLLVDGTRVQQRDWTGDLLWQLDVEQRVGSVQRSIEGDIAVCTHERGYPPRGRLVVLDRAGSLRWSFDDHAIVGAVFRAPELAFDDLGHLYTLVTGRLGDGVSGDDVATGGCRGFDRDGHPLWNGSLAVEHPNAIQGSDRGVVVVGMRRVHAFDPMGAPQWQCELDEGSPCTLPSLGLELVRSCERTRLSRILARRPGGGTVLHGHYDSDDTFYFARLLWSPPRIDLLLALDSSDRLRWQLPLRATPWELPVPVIGPRETVLLPYGDELIAIG